MATGGMLPGAQALPQPCGPLKEVASLEMSALAEAHQWMEKAAHSLDIAGLRDSRQEMVLQMALGVCGSRRSIWWLLVTLDFGETRSSEV